MGKLEDRSRMDELVDLLADVVAERLKERRAGAPATPAKTAISKERPAKKDDVEPSDLKSKPEMSGLAEAQPVEETEPDLPPPPLPGPSHAARLMSRLALGLLLMVVLINIPINCHGTTLATAMPDAQSLVIRDGLVVKEEDDPEIYVYRHGAFHWISSMDAFKHYGYTWGDVRIVRDGFLDEFAIGGPIHVLLKCSASPHVYRLENGKKRWIVDIPTFVAEGHVWERDIKTVSCEELRNLPDGETIPPGRGPAPQP